MAQYHLSCSIKSGPKSSAVAASAYISGEALFDDTDGLTKKYRNTERILDSGGLVLPQNVPEGIHDRATLWNAIEGLDGLHGQYCRSWDIALPHELSLDQQRALVLDFIDREITSRGMIADWAIHDKDENKKSSPTDQNIHVHIMTTMRPIVQDRLGKWQFGKKWRSVTERDSSGKAICIGRDKRGHKRYKKHNVPATDWNEKATLLAIRKGWADAANEALQRAGSDARIDHRSNRERGFPYVPTIHLGPTAARMEREGQRSQRGDYNRRVRAENQRLENALDQLKELKQDLVVAEMPWKLDERLPWLFELQERLENKKETLTKAMGQKLPSDRKFILWAERKASREALIAARTAYRSALQKLRDVEQNATKRTDEIDALLTGRYNEKNEPGIWGTLNGSWRKWTDERKALVAEKRDIVATLDETQKNERTARGTLRSAVSNHKQLVRRMTASALRTAESRTNEGKQIRRIDAALAVVTKEIRRINTKGRERAAATRNEKPFIKGIEQVRAAGVARAAQPPAEGMARLMEAITRSDMPPARISLETDDDALKNWDLLSELEKDEIKMKEIYKDI